MNDRVKITGIVTAWQEDENGNKEIVISPTQNHFVDAGLKSLISFLLGDHAGPINAFSHEFKIYLGRDTSTATSHNLTALIDPIGTAPGTEPNVTSGEDRTNPSTGVWKAGWIAQWNAGTISGIIGEVALYLRPFDTITEGWYYEGTAKTYTRAMISRLSAHDSDFYAVNIDTSKSFVVYWEIQISFA